MSWLDTLLANHARTSSPRYVELIDRLAADSPVSACVDVIAALQALGGPGAADRLLIGLPATAPWRCWAR